MAVAAAAVAAQRARARRELVNHLRQERALSAAAAIALRPQRRIGQRALLALVNANAVIEAGEGLYWLNETGYAAMRAKRLQTVLVLRATVVVVSAIAIGLSVTLGMR